MATRELPARHQLKSYSHAVAGHPGTMSDEDGELFIKPCTETEVGFYQSANRRFPDFADLMPVFMGTLSLSDVSESAAASGMEEVLLEAESNALSSALDMGEVAVADSKPKWEPGQNREIKTNKAIVLGNSSHGFKHPNILDAKLGIRLWADDAPPEKKRRFDSISRETTHANLGFRIAGMRAYKGSENPDELDEHGFKVYGRDFGRLSVNDDNVVSQLRKYIFNPAAGIDDEVGKAVAGAFVRDLRRVEDVLSRHESRMYSASVLFVFEGDGEALRAAIEKNNGIVDELLKRNPDANRTTTRIDSGIGMEEDDYDEDGEDYDDDDDLTAPNIHSVRLIDFAHAEWTPGQGPDENSLVGVRSLIRIFEEMAQ